MKSIKEFTIKFSFVFATLALFNSCECSRSANGQILDETTQLPIDSVKVKALTILFNEDYSDSTGNYVLGSKMTGAVGGCPDLEVSFSKEGYQDLIVINPDDDIVYMKKK